VKNSIKYIIFQWFVEWRLAKEFILFVRQEWHDAYEEYRHWIPAVYVIRDKMAWFGDNWEFFNQKCESEIVRHLIKKKWVTRRDAQVWFGAEMR
jgi:hypothetical protein